ncbi:putative NRPS-like enzyme [Aspergillus homomorphus CBS 101889]|uniref:Acetyl-CoA synthetase-like protein n=1 Tax=Aspergillus homomorphus (strain CBS 101889) TaxID=1450537 RepID=A0A395IAT4_ASPHC|nr:acetyl-CoA synthetase-like protein [Aspergillus homomorphus CBS 101889]RAL17287.1 acetyl-CoA synthetase-like protein [Aspergillus homomorphus CBS 101889]
MAATVVAAVDSLSSPEDPVALGLVNDNRRRSSTNGRDTGSAKRQRRSSESSLVHSSHTPRQKITRACDHCKEKKTRCTGTIPCVRCTRLSLACEYNAAYSRGLPPEPLPASADDHQLGPTRAVEGPRTRRLHPVARSSPRIGSSLHHDLDGRNNNLISQRNSPDPAVTDLEGNYLGPASGLSFLNRVWRRLHHDEKRTVPDTLQNGDEWPSQNTSVFMFGDKPYSAHPGAGFTLPSYEKARELATTYFDLSMVTYRFLHRGSVDDWLRQVYECNVSVSNPPSGDMVARTAIIFMIFAVGTLEQWYAASKSMTSLESGAPRLETVQARLGQCFYLLSSSRANECWYSFGTTLQLVTALGLHRRHRGKLSHDGNSYLDRELRKRLFWSTYTLDKYLSVMFGRPRLLHDEDIDQELPDEVHDEDILHGCPSARPGLGDCMMTASILHFRLGRILGDVSRQLYTVSPLSRDASFETAARLMTKLEAWKAATPPLFNGVCATSLIPPLCRQSQVLQLAYSHAVIHTTRSFLLNDFTDLNRTPQSPHPTVTHHVLKCIEAAEQVMRLVDSLAKQRVLIQSFWFTHYDIHRLYSLFSLAEACQQHLAEVTRRNSPSRRYSIILEELRREVRRRIGSSNDTSEEFRAVFFQAHGSGAEHGQMYTASFYPSRQLEAGSFNYQGGLQPTNFTPSPLDSEMDLSFLDSLEGSLLWTQIDSWDDNASPQTSQWEPLTIDELVRQRASLSKSQPIISYPHNGTKYVDYPLRQLDVYAFRVSQVLAKRIPPRNSSAETPAVVSLLGPSDLNYLVMLLSLAKLGHSGLLLSTRISIDAYVSLLERTQSRHIFIHPSFRVTAEEIKKRLPDLLIDEIPTQECYDFPVPDEEIDTNLTPYLDPAVESKHIAWIIHSSGSTGLPKPIFHTQQAALKNYAGHMNMSGFVTLPLYHNHGISCLFRTIHAGKQLHLYTANLPLTRQYLLDIMESNNFEIFYGVPYALKLLAETSEGIAALSKFKAVMFGGSACPDSLGNLLVENGVHLISHYGSTETGQLMMSTRPREDRGWDWLRPSELVQKYLQFEERFPGVFELICLDGWPSKVTSNRPDGSYATKDLFVKHPTMTAYKYYARLDDTLVLVNGEKVNPLDLEGRVRQSSAVSEAVVFGAGKACIGLAIIRAPDSQSMSDEEVVDAIWPAVETAHESMPAFGQLSKNMVRVLPADTRYPRTDKGTVIRQGFYREYERLIEEAYEAEDAMTGTLVLPEAGLRSFLREKLLEILPLKNQGQLTDDADFFALGMDSLQATQLRSVILRNIDTDGQKLGLNIAFEQPTIRFLARYLDNLMSGATDSGESIVGQMQAMIDKYSQFEEHVPCANGLEGGYILVTGATGSLGSHVVAQLAADEDVKKIYCLIRAPSTIDAYTRLHRSLQSRRIYDSLSAEARSKLIALPSDLSDPHLGLSPSVYTSLTTELTTVIHCAWSVNFNLTLRSLERDNIGGLRHLLSLCLKTQRPRPATFNFCSSVSSVVNSDTNPVPETLPSSLSAAQGMGYAQSKLVAEHICTRAAPHMEIRILRIGQIIGDTQHGIWNTTEAIPLILQSAHTVGALPALDEEPLWLPVDVVAQTIRDISLSSAPAPLPSPSPPAETSKSDKEGIIYNIVNPTPFHWTRDLLPLLRSAGLTFEELPPKDWVQRLREHPDPVRNPPAKLMDFFAGKYDFEETVLAARRKLRFRTERAKAASEALEAVGSVVDREGELVRKMVGWFLGVGWV